MVLAIQVAEDFDNSPFYLQLGFLRHQRRKRCALEVAARLNTEVHYALDVNVELLQVLGNHVLLQLVEFVGDAMVEGRVKILHDGCKQIAEGFVCFIVSSHDSNLNVLVDDTGLNGELDIATQIGALFLTVGPDVSR